MIGTGPLNGFKVHPKSIENIRESAVNLLQFLGMENTVQDISLDTLLDYLNVNYAITYEVLEAEYMPSPYIEACCIPESLVIHIREDVFENLSRGQPRARFTVIHELGHMLLGHSRTLNRGGNGPLKSYEDSEWQANQFAAEFLMPLSRIKELGLYSPQALASYFNTSLDAANIRLNQLKKRGEI